MTNEEPKGPELPADEAVFSQEAKPVAQSASPAGEKAAVQAGQARPADPKDADDVLTHKLGDDGAQSSRDRNAADAAVLAASRKRTRRAFVGFGAAAAAAYGFRRFLKDAPFEQMIPASCMEVTRGTRRFPARCSAIMRLRRPTLSAGQRHFV